MLSVSVSLFHCMTKVTVKRDVQANCKEGSVEITDKTSEKNLLSVDEILKRVILKPPWFKGPQLSAIQWEAYTTKSYSYSSSCWSPADTLWCINSMRCFFFFYFHLLTPEGYPAGNLWPVISWMMAGATLEEHQECYWHLLCDRCFMQRPHTPCCMFEHCFPLHRCVVQTFKYTCITQIL